MVWIVTLIAFGLRRNSGLPLYVEVSTNYLNGKQIYISSSTDWVLNYCSFARSQRAGLPPYLEIPKHLADPTSPEAILLIESHRDRFAYPPVTALATVPLVPFPELVQRILWCGFNSGLLILSIAMITRVARPVIEAIARRQKTTVGLLFAVYWTVIGLVMARHVLSPFENQSHDVIILALLASAALASTLRREVLVGIVLGVATAIKLTPLLFLVLLVVQGRLKAAIAMVTTTLICTIAPDLMIPNNTGNAHLTHFYAMISPAAQLGKSGGEGQWESWNPLNQNLSGTIYRLTASPTDEYPYYESMKARFPLLELSSETRSVLTLSLQGLIFLAVIVAAWKTRGPPDSHPSKNITNLATFGMVTCAMLLLSPQSSKSHFIVLMIPAAAIILHYLKAKRDWLDLILLVGAGIFGSLTAQDIIGDHNSETLLVIGSVAICAVLLGIGCLRICWATETPDEHEVHSESTLA